jgi:hypothetical protein
MKILSIDLALAFTGFAVLRDGELIDYGVIETKRVIGQQGEFQRVDHLHGELQGLLMRHRSAEAVVIERTDWAPGRGDNRDAWVREAKARDALGIAFAVCCCACIQLAIEPVIVGPREWQAEFGAGKKLAIAELVAAQFPERFRVGIHQYRSPRTHQMVMEKAVIDRKTGECVPSHVTDAAAMGVVVENRMRLAGLVERGERPA